MRRADLSRYLEAILAPFIEVRKWLIGHGTALDMAQRTEEMKARQVRGLVCVVFFSSS